MTDDELKELVLTPEGKAGEAVIEKDGAALGELFANDYIEITVDGNRIEKSKIVEAERVFGNNGISVVSNFDDPVGFIRLLGSVP